VAYHFLPYWAATNYLAFGDCEGDLWDAIRYHSPVNRVNDMQNVPYFIICCDSDVPVPMESHASVLIKRMKAAGKDVDYIVLEGMGHCEHTPAAMDKLISFICEQAKY
jgi:acetyl esterase/lipase